MHAAAAAAAETPPWGVLVFVEVERSHFFAREGRRRRGRCFLSLSCSFSPTSIGLSLSVSHRHRNFRMLLRALAATSAEGWEEEEEEQAKMRSVANAIKNVVDDSDENVGPLKQPAPSTFGSFLGARGDLSSVRRPAEYSKDRGKRRERKKRKRERKRNGRD